MGDGNDSLGLSLPLFIKIAEQAQHDSFTTFGVLEISHDLKPSPHFPKTSLNHVGGADDFMKLWRRLKERDELVEIFL